jgi:hypothetical protein
VSNAKRRRAHRPKNQNQQKRSVSAEPKAKTNSSDAEESNANTARTTSVQPRDKVRMVKQEEPAKEASSEKDTKLPDFSPFLMMLLLGAIIVLGHLFGPYIAHPSRLRGAWLDLYAILMSVMAFAATSTLTSLAYCLVALRKSELAKKFFEAISVRSVVGVVLGSLLGLRLAASVHGMSFDEYTAEIANLATIFTLIMIASCWWFSWGPAIDAGKGIFAESKGHSRNEVDKPRQASRQGEPGRIGNLIGILIVVSGNVTGLATALSVFHMIAP